MSLFFSQKFRLDQSFISPENLKKKKKNSCNIISNLRGFFLSPPDLRLFLLSLSPFDLAREDSSSSSPTPRYLPRFRRERSVSGVHEQAAKATPMPSVGDQSRVHRDKASPSSPTRSNNTIDDTTLTGAPSEEPRSLGR